MNRTPRLTRRERRAESSPGQWTPHTAGHPVALECMGPMTRAVRVFAPRLLQAEDTARWAVVVARESSAGLRALDPGALDGCSPLGGGWLAILATREDAAEMLSGMAGQAPRDVMGALPAGSHLWGVGIGARGLMVAPIVLHGLAPRGQG